MEEVIGSRTLRQRTEPVKPRETRLHALLCQSKLARITAIDEATEKPRRD